MAFLEADKMCHFKRDIESGPVPFQMLCMVSLVSLGEIPGVSRLTVPTV